MSTDESKVPEEKQEEVYELAENPLKGEIVRIADQIGYKKLTDAKINWLAAYLLAEPDVTDTEIANRANLNSSTPVYWRRDNTWIELIWRVAVTREIKHLPAVWKAVRMKAEKGDIAAARLYTNRYDPVSVTQRRAGQSKPDDNVRHDEARIAIKKAQERQRAIELNAAQGKTIDVTDVTDESPDSAEHDPTVQAVPVESNPAGSGITTQEDQDDA